MNFLPVEITALIFQHLFADFDLHCELSIFEAMRVCRSWRKIGADMNFSSNDGKIWRFTDEFCEMRRVLEYDDREVLWDSYYHR